MFLIRHFSTRSSWPNNSLIITLILTGTSIGFKNIASKIANELKLWLPGSAPRRRRRRRAHPPASSSDERATPPPPPPPRTDSLRLSAEDMVLVANGGLRTPSGALAHFLAAYTPAELSLARSEYLRPPLSPNESQDRDHVQPRSSLSLRADSVDVDHGRKLRPMAHQSYSYSVHTLRRQPRVRSPECDCLPTDPIPPPELFDFWRPLCC